MQILMTPGDPYETAISAPRRGSAAASLSISFVEVEGPGVKGHFIGLKERNRFGLLVFRLFVA
jgi:hypothetical protein